MSRRPSEAQLQKAIIEEARLRGWKVAHFRPARVRRGGKEIYETPVAADGKGFPDLTLVRDDRLMFVELKSHSGQLRDEQADWLKRLAATGAEVNIWRPNDWESGVVSRRLK